MLAVSGWGWRPLRALCCSWWAPCQTYPVVEGTKNAAATGPAVTDWRNYGGVPGGQRFAQIDQINVENVGQLKEAWEFRTGVAYDFKQTPQMANGLVYICTAGNTLMAVDADTGEKTLATYNTKTEVPGGIAQRLDVRTHLPWRRLS